MVGSRYLSPGFVKLTSVFNLEDISHGLDQRCYTMVVPPG